MIASDHEIDSDYTTGGGQKADNELPEQGTKQTAEGSTEQVLKQQYDDLCKRWENLSQEELEQLQSIRRQRGENLEEVVRNTPEHKAQRWEDYKAQRGDEAWSYERWSKQYHTNMKNSSDPLARELAYREHLGGDNKVFNTIVDGQPRKRQVDCFLKEENTMYQLKTGYEYLTTTGTTPNDLAIKADKYLVDQGYKVVWILEQGGSKQLMEALEKAGIEVKIGSQLPKMVTP